MLAHIYTFDGENLAPHRVPQLLQFLAVEGVRVVPNILHQKHVRLKLQLQVAPVSHQPTDPTPKIWIGV